MVIANVGVDPLYCPSGHCPTLLLLILVLSHCLYCPSRHCPTWSLPMLVLAHCIALVDIVPHCCCQYWCCPTVFIALVDIVQHCHCWCWCCPTVFIAQADIVQHGHCQYWCCPTGCTALACFAGHGHRCWCCTQSWCWCCPICNAYCPCMHCVLALLLLVQCMIRIGPGFHNAFQSWEMVFICVKGVM